MIWWDSGTPVVVEGMGMEGFCDGTDGGVKIEFTP